MGESASFCNPSHHPYANLKKEVKWDCNEDKGHQVGRGNDGGGQHNDNESVFAIFRKHFGGNNAHFPQEECDDW